MLGLSVVVLCPNVLLAQTSSVRGNGRYVYDMLDPTTNINRKQLLLLDNKRRGEIPDDSVTLGGAVTAIADFHQSNTAGKFGYLMRHPTSNNQVGRNASEAVVHSAQLSITGTGGSWVTAHMELLYDPEQSFGQGTITALTRNQIQLRRGYVLLGDLEKLPVYVSLGKMATPFGLTDTVNPFTASTVWHAFGGLAYGVQAGYSKDGFGFSFMGVQGGAQFRSAHAPVDATAIPSRLNNYVVDANYSASLGNPSSWLLFGASYEKGSAYCQGFPVEHFHACENANPAYDVYAQAHDGRSARISGVCEDDGCVARDVQSCHPAVRGAQGEQLWHRRKIPRDGRGHARGCFWRV